MLQNMIEEGYHTYGSCIWFRDTLVKTFKDTDMRVLYYRMAIDYSPRFRKYIDYWMKYDYGDMWIHRSVWDCLDEDRVKRLKKFIKEIKLEIKESKR